MRYIDFIDKIKKICLTKKFKMLEFGRAGINGEYKLYKIIIENKSDKTICFAAGIHGDEISGPLGVLEFLSSYKRNNYPNIVFYPLLNPYGFDKNKRTNNKNVNLNRHYFEKLMPEDVKIIYKEIMKNKLSFIATIHEDDEKSGLYYYDYGSNINIINSLSKKGEICNEKNIYGDKASNGIIINAKFKGSLEDAAYANKIPAICLEIPDKFSLNKRIDIIKDFIRLVVIHFSETN